MALLRRHPLWILGAIAVVGVAVRVWLAYHWYGNGDLFTFEIVGGRARQDPLHTYGTNLGTDRVFYPYPPGYLPWLVGALELSRDFDLQFHFVAQLLPIAADVCVALAVYVFLGWRGAGEGHRVAGFALVMLGPVFVAISGYHGQMDALATLPGVLALMIWERRPGSSRALESGVLIGLGAVIKTVPMLLVLPLLASAHSLREGVRLAGAAVGVAVLLCLPFLLAEPEGFRKVISYSGVPGRGGLSVIADPGFAADRRLSPGLAVVGVPNGFADWISSSSGPITLIVLVALAAFLFRYRPASIDGIVLLWLAVFVFSPNFLLQYLVWALPFFVMAGYLRETAMLQLAMVPVLVITYLSFDAMTRTLANAYVVMMIGLWVFWVVALITVVRRIMRRGASTTEVVRPPLVDYQPAVGTG